MQYINRAIERYLREAQEQFPILAVTGPRQAGKSTLLQHLFPEYPYYTFDDPVLRRQAKDDPGLFLETLSPPAILDEIQYVPELLPHLKMSVDRRRELTGRYFLTGSQTFHLMAGLTETLAGRIALFELLPFSREELGYRNSTPLPKLFELLFRGFYPDPCVHGVNPRLFYSSYVQTYLERDIRQITAVQDLSEFQRFVEVLAARVGSVLNLSEVGRDCGITHSTARKWLSLLESSRIVYLLRPYFANIGKRLIKSPKLYFTDTGLLAYLLKYPDPATYLAGPMAGQVFENFIIMELVKYKLNHHAPFDLYFYRDSNRNEIDVIVEQADRMHAIEIKMRQNIGKNDVRFLDRFNVPRKSLSRWLVSCYPHEMPLTPLSRNIPWWKALSVVAP